ncbi:MAG TPA: TIGR03619 family F420-dependent LLM class oxidoreductase [Solirubrobacteraceae bacterium]|jgi:probable F420-dependent oxidoreductase|nr:TIGR03619 family F420-dependent LLM class oxidoreductase [Solirubrobacteraceae bacterium]
MVLVLSECWTMTSPRDLRALVRLAQEAEDAGFDAVMLSEHVVLGDGADENGLMANPREYALPGNQDPAMPWPDSQILLGAIAAVTTRLRLFAAAIIAPLRHPLSLAKSLATLDLLSEGRLVVLPTPSWHRAEYEALGVPFAGRGERLDEHLAAWRAAWGRSPASFEGRHYRFENAYCEPKPHRGDGVALHFGSSSMHERLIERIVAYGSGVNPLGRLAPGDLERLNEAMRAARRDPAELELVGGTRAVFPDERSVADLGAALASIPEQMAAGFTTFCFKPSQFTDDVAAVGGLCREVVARAATLT